MPSSTTLNEEIGGPSREGNIRSAARVEVGKSGVGTRPDESSDRTDVLLIGFEGQENLGLRSVAAFLEREGIGVDIIPLDSTRTDELLRRIRLANPRIIGLSLIFQRMREDYAALIGHLREQGVTAHLTVGGHYPTFEYESMLSSIPGLDTVVRYEGEETLLELVRQLDRPKSWPSIKGLAFRSNSQILATPLRPLIADLDSLPFPVRNPDGATHRGIGIRSIAGSRGCYYDCTFCSIHEFYRRQGPTRRTRSPAHLVREIQMLYHDLGARIFVFQDDDVFMRGRAHREWLESFLAELEARSLSDRILWRVSCRVDDVDAGLLRSMKAAGLSSVYLGIESGCEQGLKTFNKHYGVADILATLAILKQSEMPFEFGFMLFEPYSTLGTIRENIDFLGKIGQYGNSLVHFCKMSPYAGTPIARQLAAEGRLEGTQACPDYRFLDPRLDLLQTFCSQTFNFRNFDDHGLVERLRFAKFDTSVVAKFFPDDFDHRKYQESLGELIHLSNESALETMSLAAHFVESHDLEQVMNHWEVLQDLSEQQSCIDRQISAGLDQLMAEYGFEASVGSGKGRTRFWPPEVNASARVATNA